MLRSHTKTCMVPHHMPKFYLKKIINIGEKFTLTQKKGIPMPIIGPFTLHVTFISFMLLIQFIIRVRTRSVRTFGHGQRRVCNLSCSLQRRREKRQKYTSPLLYNICTYLGIVAVMQPWYSDHTDRLTGLDISLWQYIFSCISVV